MPDPAPRKPGDPAAPRGETAGAGGWVRRRVVVRSRVRGETGPSGGPALTDAVGVVEEESDEEIVVRHRDGGLRRVAREDIVAIKEVPPPPERRGPADPGSASAR